MEARSPAASRGSSNSEKKTNKNEFSLQQSSEISAQKIKLEKYEAKTVFCTYRKGFGVIRNESWILVYVRGKFSLPWECIQTLHLPLKPSGFVSDIMELLDVSVRNSRPYHPQSQGKCERSHATWKNKLDFDQARGNTGKNFWAFFLKQCPWS